MLQRGIWTICAVGVAWALSATGALPAHAAVAPAAAPTTAPAAPVPNPANTPLALPPSPTEPLKDLAQRIVAPPGAPSSPTATAVPARPVEAVRPLLAAAGAAAAPALSLDPHEKLPLGRASATQPASGNARAAAPLDAGSSNWWVTTLTALGVVILLILALRAIAAKWSGRSAAVVQSPVLEVLTRVTVAPRNHILLVRLGHRILVVGDSTAGLRTLANIRRPEEVAALLTAVSAGKPHSITGSFGRVLADMNGEYPEKRRRAEEGGDHAEYQLDRARDQVSGLLARLRHLAGRGGGG